MAQPENFAHPPPARRGDAVADRPRPQGRRALVRAGGPARRPGDARPERRHPARRRDRAGLARRPAPVVRRTRAGAAHGATSTIGRRSRSSPRSLRRRAVPARHGPVVGPPAGGLRLDLADVVVRRGALDPRRSPSGTRSPPTRRWPTSSPRAGARSSRPASTGWSMPLGNFAVIDHERRPVAVPAARRPRAAQLPGFRAVVRLHVRRLRGRDLPVPAPRPGRRVHPHRDRAGAARRHPVARGHPARWSPGSPGGGAAGRPAPAGSIFVWGIVGARRRVRGHLHAARACRLGLRAAAADRPRREAGSAGRAAATTASSRSTPAGSSTGPGAAAS